MTKIAPLFDAVTVLAQTGAPSGGPGGFTTTTLIAYGALFAAMYFLMIAPQRKKQKELQKSIEALEAGDEVITTGGIYGEITNKKADRFVVRIAENTKVEVGKSFIQAVAKKSEEKSK